MSLALVVATGAVRGGTSILFAALGETISERAGVVNLGIEGSMLCGALAAYAVTAETGNLVGRPRRRGDRRRAAVARPRLLRPHARVQPAGHRPGRAVPRARHHLAVRRGLRAGRRHRDGARWDIPLLSSIPWIGEVFFQQDPITYLSYLAVPACWWLLFRSRWGLLLRAAGERREVLTTYGHPADPHPVRRGRRRRHARRHRWRPAVDRLHRRLVREHDAGPGLHRRGGGDVRRPPCRSGSQAGSYLFGAALALSPALQARGYSINQFALDAAPYLVTILVLVIFGRRQADQETPRSCRRSSRSPRPHDRLGIRSSAAETEPSTNAPRTNSPGGTPT